MSKYSEEETKEWIEAWRDWYDTCMLNKITDEHHIAVLCRAINKLFKDVMDKAKAAGRPPLDPVIADYENYMNPDKPYFRVPFLIFEHEYLELKKKEERKAFKRRKYLESGGKPEVFYSYCKKVYPYFVQKRYVSQSLFDNTDDSSDDDDITNNPGDLDLPKEYLQLEINDIMECVHDFFEKHLGEKSGGKIIELTSEIEQAALFCKVRNISMNTEELLGKVKMGKSQFIQLGKDIKEKRMPEYWKENKFTEKEEARFMYLLEDVLDEWTKTSEIGKWIDRSFPRTARGKKRHYSATPSVSSNKPEQKPSTPHNEQR